MQQSLSRRRLPDGIQDFRTIREGGYYYVDKTPLIAQLVDEGRHYFLSRPRRFGKSLLVDTIKSLFEGREELFRGLAVHDRWDWSARNPVLRLSFGAKYGESGDLQGSILNKLRNIEETADLPKKLFDSSGPEYLENLLINLHRKSGRQVVVLVDEYDKPILDALIDPKLAEKNRDYLRGFYGVIKDNAEHVRFVLVTGVSMFTKVSLFSGLNNLKNISLNPRYSSICGFTEEELDAVFAPELEGLDRDEVRRWYNGYSWRGGEKVYNPHDVLLLFDEREFESHWFETGSPAFLLDLLVRRKVDPMSLENRVAKSDLISRFDIDGIEVEALMFQSGYLTIVGEERRKRGRMFTLDYPNQEVRQSFSSSLLKHVTDRDLEAESRGEELGDLLAANDFAGFAERLQAYLSGCRTSGMTPARWSGSRRTMRACCSWRFARWAWI